MDIPSDTAERHLLFNRVHSTSNETNPMLATNVHLRTIVLIVFIFIKDGFEIPIAWRGDECVSVWVQLSIYAMS
jgi:hypothetical protein